MEFPVDFSSELVQFFPHVVPKGKSKVIHFTFEIQPKCTNLVENGLHEGANVSFFLVCVAIVLIVFLLAVCFFVSLSSIMA